MDDDQDPMLLTKKTKKITTNFRDKSVCLEASGMQKNNCTIVFKKRMKTLKNVLTGLKIMWRSWRTAEAPHAQKKVF